MRSGKKGKIILCREGMGGNVCAYLSSSTRQRVTNGVYPRQNETPRTDKDLFGCNGSVPFTHTNRPFPSVSKAIFTVETVAERNGPIFAKQAVRTKIRLNFTAIKDKQPQNPTTTQTRPTNLSLGEQRADSPPPRTIR